MAIEISNLCLAMGSVQANGATVFANGCVPANTGAGTYTLTLDGGGVDATESVIEATIRGATAGFITTAHNSDTVKNVSTFNTAGAATNLAFDFIVFQKPSTP